MTAKEELSLWQSVKEILEVIPNDMRSNYHTNYLNEVSQRVYECKELAHHINKQTLINAKSRVKRHG